jgi:ABC-type antimicrobial peptide transport system permease subunit
MPECYMPYGQHGFNGPALSLVVRTTGDPNALTRTLRSVAHEEAPMKFTTMEAVLAENVAAPRFRTVLFAVFGALAVCLAIAGIYGVVVYAVGQRTNEIGVRIALGAGPGSVVRLVLGQGLLLAGIGLGLGFAASIAGTRLLKSMLFQVQPNDPWVYTRCRSDGRSGDAGCRLCSGKSRNQDRSCRCTKGGIKFSPIVYQVSVPGLPRQVLLRLLALVVNDCITKPCPFD